MTKVASLLARRVDAKGSVDLADLSFEMAVAVAAEIIGLNESPLPDLTKRLDRFFRLGSETQFGLFRSLAGFLKGQFVLAQFFFYDVRPAIRMRRKQAREDIISHLIGEGFSSRQILTECLTYSIAGMATTREFITMAAWHLLEDSSLRGRFVSANEEQRIAILEEILRVDPVLRSLYRRTTEAKMVADGDEEWNVPKNALIEIDIATSNTDEATVGTNPYQIDPARRQREPKMPSAVLSFGDGPHKCPGSTVAMVESAIFLTAVLVDRPKLRLLVPPTLSWNSVLSSYELRNAMVSARQETVQESWFGFARN